MIDATQIIVAFIAGFPAAVASIAILWLTVTTKKVVKEEKHGRMLYILWFAVATHFLWGTLILLYGESVTWITAIHHTLTICPHIPTLGVLYILIATGATLSILGKLPGGPFIDLLGILPQQLVLVYSAIGALEAMVLSTFADGVIRPREFIVADQAPAIFLAAFHTAAIVEAFIRKGNRRWK